MLSFEWILSGKLNFWSIQRFIFFICFFLQCFFLSGCFLGILFFFMIFLRSGFSFFLSLLNIFLIFFVVRFFLKRLSRVLQGLFLQLRQLVVFLVRFMILLSYGLNLEKLLFFLVFFQVLVVWFVILFIFLRNLGGNDLFIFIEWLRI